MVVSQCQYIRSEHSVTAARFPKTLSLMTNTKIIFANKNQTKISIL